MAGDSTSRLRILLALLVVALGWSQGVSAAGQVASESARANPLREAYYGDLHVHTEYSFDAHSFGTRIGPDVAYRFARGETVDYLGRPARRDALDFIAVTDHAESMGVLRPSASELARLGAERGASNAVSAVDRYRQAREAAGAAVERDNAGKSSGPMGLLWKLYGELFINPPSVTRDGLRALASQFWKEEVELANQYYVPGKFTTLIGYEWAAGPNGLNLHRNVIFGEDSAPPPFSVFDGTRPEDLWDWLERTEMGPSKAMAIPHNSNLSNGVMFDWVDSWGMPLTPEYAARRQRFEPLAEICQSKGVSETDPKLSPNDPFADFQILNDRIGGEISRSSGSYLRDALKKGLALQKSLGANPFKYGFVGASDLHSGLTVNYQADYKGGHLGTNLGGGRASKSDIERMFSSERNLRMGPGCLTGVWAEENTRATIFDALRRRETFVTSGSKLEVRFFGGWSFADNLPAKLDWLQEAYAQGVRMGADLPVEPTRSKSPTFLVWAARDPNGPNLDRIQIIKLWVDAKGRHEEIHDVVWAGQRERNASTRMVPPIANTVDLATGRYDNTTGAAMLAAVWRDPDFNQDEPAAYYARILEIPTPRWSTLLAIGNGVPLAANVPAVQQQRAWSSPIWYDPSRAL